MSDFEREHRKWAEEAGLSEDERKVDLTLIRLAELNAKRPAKAVDQVEAARQARLATLDTFEADVPSEETLRDVFRLVLDPKIGDDSNTPW